MRTVLWHGTLFYEYWKNKVSHDANLVVIEPHVVVITTGRAASDNKFGIILQDNGITSLHV